MVRQTKRFKKGLNKKVLSAILAASMIMTSSSFAMAAPLADDTLTDETVVTGEVEETEEVDNGVAMNSLEPADQVDAYIANQENDLDISASVPGQNVSYLNKVITGVQYTGQAIEPEFTIKDKTDSNSVLVKGTDYVVTYGANNTDSKAVSGKDGTATISFINDYQNIADINVTFEIGQVPIGNSNATVDISGQDAFVYNGKEQYPTINSVVVNANGQTYNLTSEDYEVIGMGADLVNAGQKTGIQIQGVGNYSGTVSSAGFEIQKASMAGNVTVDAKDTVFSTEDGTVIAAIKNNITVVDNYTGKAIPSSEYTLLWYDEEEGDYTTSATPSTDIGTHSFRVTGVDAGVAGNFNKNTYVEGTYEIVEDGTLQMSIDQMINKKGWKIDGFESDGEAFVATYNGKDLYVEASSIATHLANKDGAGLASNQFEVVENKAEWKNASEYTVTVNGKNDFAGETATITFKINPKALNQDAENEAAGIDVVATQGKHQSGAEGDLIVTVTDGDVVLKEGTDYTYEVTTKDDESYVVVTGIGNYTTELSDDVKNLTIKVKPLTTLDLNDSSISAEVTGTYKYTGNQVKPSVSSVKLVETDSGEEIDIPYTDLKISYGENVYAGEGVVYIEVKLGSESAKYYSGKRAITFTIEGESFEDTFALAEMKDFDINDTDWSDILSAVKVVYQNGGATYAVGEGTNSDRIDVKIAKDGEEINTKEDKVTGGTYTVTVTPTDKNGAGRYEGELTTTFNVIGTDLKTAGAKIADIDDQVYTSEAITPAVVVTVGNKTLEEGKDYTVAYSDNIKGGEATVTVTGINDYSGTIEKNFKITQADQSIRMTVAAQERDLANGSRTTGSNKCTLKLGFGMEDADLNLSYATSDKSVATVDGNGVITYQGVGECTITVTAKATDSCKEATLPITVKVGNPGTPTFTPSVTKNTAKKAFVVTSSTVRGADGFEVQYSIRSDFWRATTKDFSNTGSKLLRQTCKTVHSNRTYYVRVRAYQIVDGEKVYSKDWSPVKTIKTK